MRISDWSSDVCSSDLRTPRLSWSGCGKPVPDDTWIARQSKQDDLRTAPRADAPARADAAARRRYTRHPGRHPRHSRAENPLLQGCRDPLEIDSCAGSAGAAQAGRTELARRYSDPARAGVFQTRSEEHREGKEWVGR